MTSLTFKMLVVLGKRASVQYRWCLPLVTVSRTFCFRLPLPTCLPSGCKDDIDRVKRLEMKVKEARAYRKVPPSHKNRSRIERVDLGGYLFCYACETFQKPTAFSIDVKRKFGRRSICKACVSEASFYYYGFTLRGALRRVLDDAKKRAVKRSKMPDRLEAGRFELDLNLLLNLWLHQQGRCAYSGLVMNMEPFTAWRFSLERRNNQLGYVPGNIIFTCAEFNTSDHSIHAKRVVFGSSQWSREKVELLPQLISASIPKSDDEIRNLTSSVGARRLANRKRVIALNGDLMCTKCSRHKSPFDFAIKQRGLGGRSSVCKECQAQYRWSFAGFFNSRLESAKSSARRKAEKGREGAGVFNLSLNDVVALYKRQRGVCFYSWIQLTLKPVSQWMCSIERLDNAKGYTVDNVVLICYEFQSSDQSWAAKTPVKGTSQWSQEKVKMLVQWLSATKPTSRK